MRLMMVLLLLACTGIASAYDDIAHVKFVTCHDGDTCTFELHNVPSIFERIEVRFRGVDAPELRGQCEQEIAKAIAAKSFVSSILTGAKSITLTKVHRDKYFRINAFIIADGINLSDALKQHGLAVEYWGRGPKQNWCHAG